MGDLILNQATYDVSRAGKEVALNRTEFRLLRYLMRRSGRTKSPKRASIQSVWDSTDDVDDNLLDVTIYQLRKRVERGHKVKLIKTVRNLGYAIRDPARHHDAPNSAPFYLQAFGTGGLVPEVWLNNLNMIGMAQKRTGRTHAWLEHRYAPTTIPRLRNRGSVAVYRQFIVSRRCIDIILWQFWKHCSGVLHVEYARGLWVFELSLYLFPCHWGLHCLGMLDLIYSRTASESSPARDGIASPHLSL